MKSKKSIQRSGHKEWRGHPLCIVTRDFSPNRCKVNNIFLITGDFRRNFAENVESGVILCLSECRREIIQISDSKKFLCFYRHSERWRIKNILHLSECLCIKGFPKIWWRWRWFLKKIFGFSRSLPQPPSIARHPEPHQVREQAVTLQRIHNPGDGDAMKENMWREGFVIDYRMNSMPVFWTFMPMSL